MFELQANEKGSQGSGPSLPGNKVRVFAVPITLSLTVIMQKLVLTMQREAIVWSPESAAPVKQLTSRHAQHLAVSVGRTQQDQETS